MKHLALLLIPPLLYGCIDTGDDASGTEVSVTETGNVEGVVTDSSTSQPIQNVSVFIGSSTSDNTTSSGVYSIGSVDTGTRTITASLTGYESYSGAVSITKGTTISHNFTMTPTSNPIDNPEPTETSLNWNTGNWDSLNWQ